VKREERYFVMKIRDISDALTTTQIGQLGILQGLVDEARSKRGKARLRCVVVEHDWPEYEPTWEAIERRMNKTCDTCGAEGEEDCLNVPHTWGYSECCMCGKAIREHTAEMYAECAKKCHDEINPPNIAITNSDPAPEANAGVKR